MKKIIKYFQLFILIIFPFIGIQGQSCNADFEYSVVTNISSLTYQFSNKSTSSNPIINYNWSFGDGSISTKKDPEHQYLTIGKFAVTLTIFTKDSCSSSYIDTVSVKEVPPPGCVAFFTFIELTQSASYTYAFTDHSMAASGDTINSWYWNFGDGNVSNNPNPIHQFQTTGNFTVTLSITTVGSCSSSYTFIISVYNGSTPCQASFTYTQDTITNPLKYYFHDNSIHSTSITSWSWHFDDGDSSNLQDPIHVFPYAGIYYISLKVTTSGGNTSSVTYPVKVSNPKPYNVWGRVYAGPYTIDKCIAYLYKEYNNYYYKPVDTVRLTSVNDTLGVYYFFQVPEGKHKVKVLLPDASIYAEDYAPTYYGNQLKWNYGNTIYLFQDVSQANVYLKDMIKSPGNCQINVHVVSANTNLNSNSNVEVLLYHSDGSLADYTFSDNQGDASFNDVGVGSYYVSGDVTGLSSDMTSINMTSNFDTISNLFITISNTAMTGYFLHEDQENIDYLIYPNPVNNQLWIKSNKSSVKSLIEIIDVQGKVIFKEKHMISSGSDLKLDIGFINRGFYILKLTDIQSGIFSTKKLIKN